MKEYSTIPQFSLKKNDSTVLKSKIGSSQDAYNVIRQFWFDDIDIYESCFILLLDRGNNTIGWSKISQGGVAGTVVDVKIIAKYAVDSLACSIILAHNHPSGNAKPSQDDLDITHKSIEGLKFLDIKVLDHLILGGDAYLSLADEGMLY